MKIKRNWNYNARKIHRYFGVFIGIQFLFWSIGGVYFSWNNMDDVHGETLVSKQKYYAKDANFNKIQKGIDSLRTVSQLDSIHSINLKEILGKDIFQIKYFSRDSLKTQLISAENGNLLQPFNAQECLQIAEESLKGRYTIEKGTYFKENSVDLHHEYRGKPLPAFAFIINHPSNTTIYVSTELGEVTTVRNGNWRRFDFLWMLHTMDYSSRDNITNWILRVFSVLGIITILSGFVLFFLTSKTIRKIKTH